MSGVGGETRARKVTATITVRTYSYDTALINITAQRRKDALKDWLKRHRKDIENEMAQFDEVEINVEMGYADALLADGAN